MRVINVMIYMGLLAVVILDKFGKRKESSYLKGHGYLVILFLIFNSLSFALTFQKEMRDIYIERSGYGGSDKTIGIKLDNGGETIEESLEVRCRKLTEDERQERMEDAFNTLEKTLPGENESLSHVERDLDFTLDQKQYPFDVDFIPEDYRLINGEGYVKNNREELKSNGYGDKEIEEGIHTRLTVILWYDTYSLKREYEPVIFERTKTEREKQFENTMAALKKEEEKSVFDEGFSLPVTVEGIKVSLSKGSILSPASVLFAGVVIVILLVLREKENKNKMEKQLTDKLRRSYPWFVNEMLLLLGAGMQVKNIFSTMIDELSENSDLDDDRLPLVKELIRATNGLNNGMAEEQVYYQLGRRLKLPCYIKLMSLLEQNVTRGTKGLGSIFETEELAALEERKNLAKRYGEEAGTKLLGPMIILLLVVMLIIMVPAFLGFSL